MTINPWLPLKLTHTHLWTDGLKNSSHPSSPLQNKHISYTASSLPSFLPAATTPIPVPIPIPSTFRFISKHTSANSGMRTKAVSPKWSKLDQTISHTVDGGSGTSVLHSPHAEIVVAAGGSRVFAISVTETAGFHRKIMWKNERRSVLTHKEVLWEHWGR